MYRMKNKFKKIVIVGALALASVIPASLAMAAPNDNAVRHSQHAGLRETISEPQLNGNQAFIDVAVATLWAKPHTNRPIDEPSTTNPVNMWEWTRPMTVTEKLYLTGKLNTQALLGTKVTIRQQDGDWVEVEVHGQPTRKGGLMPGWMLKRQLTYNKNFADMENSPFVLITKPTTYISFDGDEILEISYNTRLPFLHENRDSYSVMLPNGRRATVKKIDGKVYASQESIPVPTLDDLINDGKQFLRLPYIWAGKSGFGFDCSGFISILFKAHGITLPRSSRAISELGTFVDKDHLQRGDVLYFAHDRGRGRVHHVAMYIGDGLMMHSPGAGRAVEIIPLNSPQYKYQEELVGGRRFEINRNIDNASNNPHLAAS